MIDEQVNSLRKHNESHQTHIPIYEKNIIFRSRLRLSDDSDERADAAVTSVMFA
jgi:hypothetical protein